VDFRIELRDKTFKLKEVLDSEALDVSWSYSSVGGCGNFNFMLPRKRFGERALTGESNIRIYRRDRDTQSHILRFQGLIENKQPSFEGNSERIPVSGHGYVIQLKRIYLNNVPYTSQEASVIVKDILDNYVVPNTDVTYDASDIEATSFTFDSVQFNDNALDSIEKIAKTVGGIEWGVDRNRKFFFKARSTSIGFRFIGGKNLINFIDNQDFGQIINQVYVQGAQVGGTYFTFGAYSNESSKIKYNLRESIIQNSSIKTESVASQFATAYLDENSEVIRRASGTLVDYDALLEATTPLTLFAEVGRKHKYGQKKYGTILYQGIVSRLVNRVNYKLSNNGGLTVSVELDHLRPKTSEIISQLKYQLDQQRSAAL